MELNDENQVAYLETDAQFIIKKLSDMKLTTSVGYEIEAEEETEKFHKMKSLTNKFNNLLTHSLSILCPFGPVSLLSSVDLFGTINLIFIHVWHDDCIHAVRLRGMEIGISEASK